MKAVLADIQNGTFAKRFIDDQDAGAPEFKALREKGEQHPIEATGRELRKLMSWVKSTTTTTPRAPPPADPRPGRGTSGARSHSRPAGPRRHSCGPAPDRRARSHGRTTDPPPAITACS